MSSVTLQELRLGGQSWGFSWRSKKWSANGRKRLVRGSARDDGIRNMSAATESIVSQLQTNRCPAPETCPLNQVRAGIPLRIKRLCTSNEVAVRLREIGFCEEQMIKLLTAGTNIICLVCNARLAISPQLAQAILVEPVHQCAA
jgi:Fe2+ transport system protein FeoA